MELAVGPWSIGLVAAEFAAATAAVAVAAVGIDAAGTSGSAASAAGLVPGPVLAVGSGTELGTSACSALAVAAAS